MVIPPEELIDGKLCGVDYVLASDWFTESEDPYHVVTVYPENKYEIINADHLTPEEVAAMDITAGEEYDGIKEFWRFVILDQASPITVVYLPEIGRAGISWSGATCGRIAMGL